VAVGIYSGRKEDKLKETKVQGKNKRTKDEKTDTIKGNGKEIIKQ
jgi:hypothetical protein